MKLPVFSTYCASVIVSISGAATTECCDILPIRDTRCEMLNVTHELINEMLKIPTVSIHMNLSTMTNGMGRGDGSEPDNTQGLSKYQYVCFALNMFRG